MYEFPAFSRSLVSLDMSSSLVPLTAVFRITSPAVILRPDNTLLSNLNKSSRFVQSSASSVSISTQLKSRTSNYHHPQCKSEDTEVTSVGDMDECSADPSGLEGQKRKQTVKGFSSKELMQGLKRFGVAGVLSYGLLNTTYYLTTFLLVWFYFAPAPGRMGYAAAVERFLKVMAMVWAGSQVTKIVRAAGALALAPFVDRGLSWFTFKFKFESKGKAFATIAGMCFGLAVLLFFGLTLLWA